MVDINKLKGAIRSKGLTQADIAASIGEKVATVNARINKKYMDTRFIDQLVEILGLNPSEIMEIFFASEDNQK